MKSGLLWYDADLQAGLPERISRAAGRYLQKFGRTPTLCYVHPILLNGQTEPQLEVEIRLGDALVRIQVIGAAHVLLHHYWLGEGDRMSGGRAARQEDHAPEAEGCATVDRDRHLAGQVQGPRGQPLCPAQPATG